MNRPGESISEYTLRESLEKLQAKYDHLKSEKFESIVGREFKMPRQFGFDVRDTDIRSLTVPTAFIIWTLIKGNHLTSDSFDEEVMNLVYQIHKYKPKNYMEFKGCIDSSRLGQSFGTYYVDRMNYRVRDDEFWLGVWYYIQHQDEFTIEYEGEVMNLSTLVMSDINPQLYI